MTRQFDAPVWVAVTAPFLALLASTAATTLVIQASWLDAICDGALRGYVDQQAAELVEACWCDLRGAGLEPLRSLAG
ncbi:MAG: hypothetical protein OXL98_06745 [Acidimicrobiaceae bacterium]|nr:hypothetical protein [Acidimicrobiaceae bacterium]